MNSLTKKLFCLLFILLPVSAGAQTYTLSGRVIDEGGLPLPGTQIYIIETEDTLARENRSHVIRSEKSWLTNDKGRFEISGLKPGDYAVTAFFPGMELETRYVSLYEKDKKLRITLRGLQRELGSITVAGRRDSRVGISRMNSVEGVLISEGKKNSVIEPTEIAANMATNNARQVYARVPGLNIWQNSDAGVQVNIGARGLSPKRNSHFNTRQNGYGIAADALGYPESYYSPPVRALKRIEVIRGAASLQYGTQFGGMLNYVFKDGPSKEPFQVNSMQTAGSYGLLSSFNSVGGNVGNARYYGFYQYKTDNGWRPNSGMDQHTAYGSITYRPNSKWRITPEYTYMYYLAQQPGGLTDRQFERDPSQSNRDRNWFRVNWNLFALKANYKITGRTELNTRFFGLKAGRDAVGNLQRIDRMDLGGRRTLLKDDYLNWGNETRFLHRYLWRDQISYVLVGTRYYNGFTHRRQGLGPDGGNPHFTYEDPDNLHGSDYDLPSLNRSVFVENVFNITPKLSITAGLRFENIRTEAHGYYRRIVKDLAGNVLIDRRIEEDRIRERSFLFYGAGAGYEISKRMELYANYSQNYRAINFNDIRVDIGNLEVDPQIQDERGYNIDIGMRGHAGQYFNYDVSTFYLSYQDRIGTVLKTAPNPRFNGLVDYTFRYRTNVADARIYGLESYAELDLYKYFIDSNSRTQLSVFSNLSLMRGTYVNAQVSGIEGNLVEHVPPINWKAGINFRQDNLKISYQYSYVGAHYSDATNAESTPTATAGIIPSYHVMDLSAEYQWRHYKIEAGINNITDHHYFTRRATGYPGPGIIPAKPRNGYISVGVEF